MAETWKVVRRRVDGTYTGNAVFEGGEDDARHFLATNYPRVHVEPGNPDGGTPDAVLVSPDGDHEACVGTQTVGNATLPHFIDVDEKGVPTDDTSDDDDDDEPTPAPAKKTAAKKTAAPPAF